MDFTREEYDRFVAESPQGSIYCYSWWLDAVAPQSWSACIVRSNGKIVAALPYRTRRKFGVVRIDQPDLCPMLGVLLPPMTGRYATQLGYQNELISELIRQLPTSDFVSSNLHYSLSNWLPFHWSGYSQTTAYTYVLEDLSRTDAIWEGFRKTLRNDIRRAEQALTVERGGSLDSFLSLNEASFRRQGLCQPVPEAVVRRVDDACERRSCRDILLAKDQEGNLHAGAYLVWDEKSAYYLMGGADPRYRKSGAQSLLLWNSIRLASTVTKAFDFEGSMNERIETFFRGFGARQAPFMNVSRQNAKYRLFTALKGFKSSLDRRLSITHRRKFGVNEE